MQHPALLVEEPLTTPRLSLERVRPDHADEMGVVLDDQRLHEFTGGSPTSVEGLRTRYQHLAALGRDTGPSRALHWIVRRKDDRAPIGAVQATMHEGEADIGWVIGTASQRQGFATEAAAAVVRYLEASGCTSIQAAIHIRHHASAGVAARAGLLPTAREVDGDRIWRRVVAAKGRPPAAEG